MSGVYDEKKWFCPLCNKETPHLTGWESSEPLFLDIQCVECYGPRMKSGPTVTEIGIGRMTNRRLVMKKDIERYCDIMLDATFGKRSRMLSARELAEQEMDRR